MTTLTEVVPITPEELLNLPDSVNYELVDDKLVERNMSMQSTRITAQILGLLWMFLHDKTLGRVFGADGSYQCFLDAPNKVRRPDVSFIPTDRLPQDQSILGHIPVAPDLAVEVISPNDAAYEVEEKIAEYLAAGVRLVWVVYPHTKQVRVHRQHGSAKGVISLLSNDEEITGEDVLPGFSCKVSEFFA